MVRVRQRHGEGGPLPKREHRAGRGVGRLGRVLVPRKQQQAQDLAADQAGLVVRRRNDELAAVVPSGQLIEREGGDIHAQALRLAPAPPTRGHRDL